MWRIRYYYKSGKEKGNVSHEEDFLSKKDAEKRYREVFVYDDLSLNPTIWFSGDGRVSITPTYRGRSLQKL